MLVQVRLLASLAVLSAASPVFGAERLYHVDHYEARIEPDLAAKTLIGHVRIDLTAESAGDETLELDRGELAIGNVSVDGQTRPFTVSPEHLLIQLARRTRVGSKLVVAVEYTGAPRFGLEFAPEVSQVYTIFSTSQWLVCNDNPSAKATIDLELVVPARLSVVANGRQISRSVRPDGKQVLGWSESRRIPPYTFGFAVGPFTQAQDDRGRLRYLGGDLSADELRQIFRETAGIRSFLERRSGTLIRWSHLHASARCRNSRSGARRLFLAVDGIRPQSPGRPQRSGIDRARVRSSMVGKSSDVPRLDAVLAK